MSTFCGGTGSVPAMTPTELRQAFTNGLLPAGLPPMENGLAANDWVRTYVQQLDAQGRLPKATPLPRVATAQFDAPESKDPLSEFVSKENTFIKSVQDEYCFYEKRYFSALDSFLTAVGDASLRGQSQATVQSRLDSTRMLNQKLTLLTQIANEISKFRYNQTSRFQQDINGLNQTLRERRKKLLEQNAILQKETAAADLHKQMVSYTTEKNRANNNLLTTYGILNLVALGLLFYIART